jgi:hypothetical protein
LTPEEFVRLMRDATGTIGLQTKLGKVASGYSSGRPTIVFDAETVASTRTYPYLGSYTPAANDRVLLIGAGNTWVVLGKIV